MERITFEIVHRDRSQTVTLRGVLSAMSGGILASTDTVRVPLSRSVPILGEPELYEMRAALEAEVRGWTAKLPLDYV